MEMNLFMKLNLKKNLEDTVNQYRDHTGEFSKKFMAEMGRFNSPEARNRYSNDGLRDLANEKHAELLASQVATGETMNQKARAVVNGVKSSIAAAVMGEGSRPEDYATRISNALRFLSYETADSLTDDVAHDLLHEFEGDYETMRKFKRIVEQKEYASAGHVDAKRFPKTFGSIEKAEEALSQFEELDRLAETVFMHQKVKSSNGVTIGDVFYSEPMDSYGETTGWDALLNLAEAVDQWGENEGDAAEG